MSTENRAEDIIKMVSESRVYDLGQPYWKGMPVHPADPPFVFFLYRYHEHTAKLFKEIAPGFADSIGYMTSSMHAGTHLDMPVHMSRNLKVMGEDITKYEDDRGYVDVPDKLPTVDRIQPIVKRAVLFDIPKMKNLDLLEERYEITPEDLEKTLEFEKVTLNPGDCALIRTGYSRFFETDSDAYLHKFAGLGAAAAKWLVDKGVSLVGVDNLAAGVPKPFEVHNIILTDNGKFLMKSLMLEGLAKDSKYVSMVVVSPLRIKGGEASLVRPIAIA